MADKQNGAGIYNFIKPHVLSHPCLHVAKPFMRDGKVKGEPKFGANFVLDPNDADFLNMKALAGKMARAHPGWGSRSFKTLHFPFSSGDKLADARKETAGKDDGAFMRGKIVLIARSKFRPALGGIEGGKLVDYEDEAKILQTKGMFYFGVQALAQLNFVAYEGGSNDDGVTAYLNQVVSTNKGEKLSKGSSPSATFSGYLGAVSNEDPFGNIGGNSDDEIPF